MPKRIQRRMTKDWRKPEGAVYVGRPGPFGNPNRVVKRRDTGGWHVEHRNGSSVGAFGSKRDAAAFAVDAYRAEVESDAALLDRIRAELAGRDLMCWCDPASPCHADVLLELVDEEVSR